ncbi:uncharacterized protein LOC126366123 isoform X2 [Pectinophora gossypiella]|nr:uncharacterized protein LOC126366123 isoform X2 [Pectinophora gossypiella]
MFGWALVVLAVCAGARAQPAACVDDSQCSSGYYCVTDLHACHECLQCRDLNREDPKPSVSCIRSVVECGPCMKGLVLDRGGEGASCTEPSAEGEELPIYVWAVVAILVLACALVAFGAIIFILRRTDTFKVLACTRTSVQAPVSNGVPPSAPPPYNYSAEYAPVRPSSPHDLPAVYPEDPSLPLVKRAPTPGGRGDAREAAASQAAQVFNNPAYVRNAQPPPSYDSALSEESDHEAPFVPQDEDTMPSPWTPGPSNSNTDNNGNSSAVALSGGGDVEAAAAAAGGGLRRPARPAALQPPAKVLCVREDSNNNRNPHSSGESSSSAPAAPAAPSVVINVLNVNSVHQLNDVTL